MDYMDEMDEDQLIDFVIQMSLQEAHSLSVLNEPLRYVQYYTYFNKLISLC